MIITFAVPDKVTLLEAEIVVAVTVPIKPFSEVTGPEKVVDAMINCPSYKDKLISLVCVCRGSLISRNTRMLRVYYIFYFVQVEKEKPRFVGGV